METLPFQQRCGPEPELEPKPRNPLTLLNQNLMHSSSATRFRFRSRIWIRIQYKIEYKSLKIKKERPTFLETMLLLTLKRQDFVQFLLLKYCARYCLEPEPEPKLQEPKTGTGINHNGSTTLHLNLSRTAGVMVQNMHRTFM
jgi:hypothetical protein